MNDTARLFLLITGAAILGALMLAIWLIGPGTLRNLAYIFVGGVVVALIIASSALPIRAAKKRDATGETRYIDGTKTIVKERIIDGRAVTSPEVKILQLPQQPAGGAWPELLRASYQAGLLGNGQQTGAPVPSSDPTEFDLTGDGDGWGGEIAP